MLIPLSHLQAHPHNANVMPEALLAKLAAHIRETGRYPPLIVRPLHEPANSPVATNDADSGAESLEHVLERDLHHRDAAAGAKQDAPPVRYQILDGHHRALALRRLGHAHAQCEVWDGVHDQQAAILLLTLNRLRGEDDPFKRGALMAGLALERPRADLVRLLPDELARIDRLMALAKPALAEAPQPPGDDTVHQPPRSLTFFLDAAAYEQALGRLRQLDADRTRALLKALSIDAGGHAGSGADAQRRPPDAIH
jgi:ParB-like chromosome segregation protein Spo0J